MPRRCTRPRPARAAACVSQRQIRDDVGHDRPNQVPEYKPPHRQEKAGGRNRARPFEQQHIGEEHAGPNRGPRQYCAQVNRSGAEYTLKRSPRRNPTSVWRNSRASATARLDGAPTAASTGMPAAIDFCTISYAVFCLKKKTSQKTATGRITFTKRTTLRREQTETRTSKDMGPSR